MKYNPKKLTPAFDQLPEPMLKAIPETSSSGAGKDCHSQKLMAEVELGIAILAAMANLPIKK